MNSMNLFSRVAMLCVAFSAPIFSGCALENADLDEDEAIAEDQEALGAPLCTGGHGGGFGGPYAGAGGYGAGYPGAGLPGGCGGGYGGLGGYGGYGGFPGGCN